MDGSFAFESRNPTHQKKTNSGSRSSNGLGSRSSSNSSSRKRLSSPTGFVLRAVVGGPALNGARSAGGSERRGGDCPPARERMWELRVSIQTRPELIQGGSHTKVIISYTYISRTHTHTRTPHFSHHSSLSRAPVLNLPSRPPSFCFLLFRVYSASLRITEAIDPDAPLLRRPCIRSLIAPM